MGVVSHVTQLKKDTEVLCEVLKVGVVSILKRKHQSPQTEDKAVREGSSPMAPGATGRSS